MPNQSKPPPGPPARPAAVKPTPIKAEKRAKAVALDYTPLHQDTPTIVATGMGKNAEKILEQAFAHGVAVREDAALVDILSAYDIGTPIPIEAFSAVAEILHYLYLADRTKAAPQPEFRPNPYPTTPHTGHLPTGRG
jgi:flagellar biosynthesis protein